MTDTDLLRAALLTVVEAARTAREFIPHTRRGCTESTCAPGCARGDLASALAALDALEGR